MAFQRLIPQKKLQLVFRHCSFSQFPLNIQKGFHEDSLCTEVFARLLKIIYAFNYHLR